MKRTLYLCALLVLSGIDAHTTRADGLSGLSFGGGYGRAENAYDTGFIDDPYVSITAAAGDKLKFTSSSVHRWDNTWWGGAGYMLSDYFGIDAMFLHVGELTHRASGEVKTSTGDEPLTDTAAVTSHGPALSMRIRLPLAESFAVDVRLGDYYARTALTSGTLFKSKYTAGTQIHTGSTLLAGVGGAYTFAGHWSVRLDYLRVNDAGDSANVGKYSANLATVGASFTF
jgi:hypothetical protein